MSLPTPSPATYNAGWVYVLSNEGHPGLLKIGLTRHSVERRLAQLNGAGTIHNHVNRFACHVSDPAILEAAAHRALADHRIAGKEFFRVSLDTAIATIERVIAEKKLKVFDRVGGLPLRDEPLEMPGHREKTHPRMSPPVQAVHSFVRPPGVSTSVEGQMTTEVAARGRASISLRWVPLADHENRRR